MKVFYFHQHYFQRGKLKKKRAVRKQLKIANKHYQADSLKIDLPDQQAKGAAESGWHV